MRSGILFLVMFVALSSAQAKTVLKCSSGAVGDSDQEAHLLIVGGTRLYCYETGDNVESPRSFLVDFINVGPGLKAARGILKIICSSHNPVGSYSTVGASCSLIAGGEARLCLNSEAKACAIIGTNWGFGGEVSVGRMDIWPGH